MAKRSDFDRIEKDYYRSFDPKIGQALATHFKDKHLDVEIHKRSSYGGNAYEILGITNKVITYMEPCCGDGALIRNLEATGVFSCLWASDKYPTYTRIPKHTIPDLHIPGDHIVRFNDLEFAVHNLLTFDAFTTTKEHVKDVDYIITNPPWTRTLLHPMIEHFANLKPTWLLFDADWAFTRQAEYYLNKYCTDIVVVGRVKWIEGTTMSGKDSVAWYRFDSPDNKDIVEFHNRRT